MHARFFDPKFWIWPSKQGLNRLIRAARSHGPQSTGHCMCVCIGPSRTWAFGLTNDRALISSAWASIQSPHHDGGPPKMSGGRWWCEWSAKQTTKALIINGSLLLLGLCQCPSVLPRLPPRSPNPKNRYCTLSLPCSISPTRFFAHTQIPQPDSWLPTQWLNPSLCSTTCWCHRLALAGNGGPSSQPTDDFAIAMATDCEPGILIGVMQPLLLRRVALPSGCAPLLLRRRSWRRPSGCGSRIGRLWRRPWRGGGPLSSSDPRISARIGHVRIIISFYLKPIMLCSLLVRQLGECWDGLNPLFKLLQFTNSKVDAD